MPAKQPPIKAAFNRFLGRYPALERRVRLAQRAHYAKPHRDHFPNLLDRLGDDAGKWQDALAKVNSPGTRTVLIPTSIGGAHGSIYMETILAMGLVMRGVRPIVILCDGTLPACQECTYKWFPDPQRFADVGPERVLCPTCFAPACRMLESLGLTVARYSDFLDSDDWQLAGAVAAAIDPADPKATTLDGLAVGEHALAGALRFFARSTLHGEPAGEAALRRYTRAAMLSARMMRAAIREHQPISVAFNHGIYVPQGPLGEACRQADVPVVNWNPAYRTGRFIFSHGDTYHHTLLNEPTSDWQGFAFGDDLERDVMQYLHGRRYGKEDWIWFHDRPQFDLSAVETELGIDLDKPYVGLLTNVAWDAQLHYPANAFDNMMQWLIETVRYFEKRSDLNLLIRIHPAEVNAGLPSRQPALGELRKAFNKLPANVFVLGPEHRASTYDVMSKANAAIIYGTKTGIELAAQSMPVIVAGEAWARGKGFTHDASDQAHYFQLLDKLPMSQMDEPTTRLARQYAYHFFFRRMIPVKATAPATDWRPYELGFDSLATLEPGGCDGLDVICRGITDGTPFVYRAEVLDARSDAPAAEALTPKPTTSPTNTNAASKA